MGQDLRTQQNKQKKALLEVMEESKVTVDGVRHEARRPFMVIATQNPVEQAGTYRLPEAQLDRFLARLSFGYPDAQEEWSVLDRRIARRREEQTVPRAAEA